MRGMILSVGGTPDPLVRSILTHKPQLFCLFPFQDSLHVSGEVKKTR